MLSSQLDTEFSADDYDEVKKVYSIWLCLNSSGYATDTITEYSMEQKKLVGDFNGKARYDLLSAVMVCIDQKSCYRKTTLLHGLLGTLFSTRLTPDEKMEILQNEYGIEVTTEMKEGTGQICKKIQKGKSLSLVAEELEEEEK